MVLGFEHIAKKKKKKKTKIQEYSTCPWHRQLEINFEPSNFNHSKKNLVPCGTFNFTCTFNRFDTNHSCLE
jgi:hypothetical protein